MKRAFTEKTIAMKLRMGCLAVCFASLVFPMSAQTPAGNSAESSSASGQVPRLIKFSGVAKDETGKAMKGVTGITFSLYKDEQGGAPLWMETQNVQPDSGGHYTVLLGSSTGAGIPLELFASGEAQWLGVQPQGQPELPRVLMVSVPYALKALDAETLGGRPASEFMMANQIAGQSAKGNLAAAATKTPGGPQPPPPCVNAGVAGRIAKFFAPNCVNSSIMVQAANRIGIGIAAPTATLDVAGSLNISTTGSFNIGTQPFAFGTLANFDAFLGFAGNSTMTGIQDTASGAQALFANINGNYNTADGYHALYSNTTASDNVASGTEALALNTTGGDNTASGFQALYSNTTGGVNTASGSQALYNNTTGGANTATGMQALYRNITGNYNTATGVSALFNNMSGIRNTASGYLALGENSTGSYNTADGFLALAPNTTGANNTAIGWGALGNSTSGSDNTASGAEALVYNTTGSHNTALGYLAGPDANSPNLSNTTAIGWNALVSQSDALILGGSGAYAVNVGIGTATPSNVFTIAQNAGQAISDGWTTYSSRRWKTNIHTLQGAMAKVEQLRGVSYDLKSSGKHEVGVIAEEVGAVVPEVVAWEKNGKDAQGVDYSRLTALLIEATKEQQAMIQTQQAQIRIQQSQIEAERRRGDVQRAELGRLRSQMKAVQASLKINGGPDTEVRTAAVNVPAGVR
jgi:hypothetical protein